MATIKEGTILAFSGGSYSDKWTTGPFDVLRDFDQAEVVAAYAASYAGKRDEWGEEVEGDQAGFISFLTLGGYIRDVARSYNWYTGDDYDFDPVIA
ncbi:hypothetical protein CWR43_28020 [Rhizobium sullae]|uniref:Uncharacterized protein n=1 Tax=Rhizobium sullae TaxID=50338 RepID=A0A2N0D2S5_RHISU|nr:hypothetical protein [Rhizobium sullae]PKA40430.1 hypothetical protein CWR43_28020 [Rhizobium sullae]